MCVLERDSVSCVWFRVSGDARKGGSETSIKSRQRGRTLIQHSYGQDNDESEGRATEDDGCRAGSGYL